MPHALSRAVARRFLVLRHLLAPPRALPAEPESVLAVVERIGSLQFDPLEVAGRNHDLVLHARVGGYRRAWTDTLLYERRLLFEAWNKGLSILPLHELPWYRITWERDGAWHGERTLRERAETVEHVLALIRERGPLSSLDFERRQAIDWYWGPTGEVRAVLEALAEAGVLGLARPNRRFYDLAARIFPADLLATRVDARDALRHKLLSRYRAAGCQTQRGLLAIDHAGHACAGVTEPQGLATERPATTAAEMPSWHRAVRQKRPKRKRPKQASADPAAAHRLVRR